jgi:aspartate aminotransferase-like enzyme
MRTVFFPGPSSVPLESIQAMSKEIVHHHSKEFSNVLTNIEISLKSISNCSGNISIIVGSGTSTAESIVDNYVDTNPTSKHLVCCNGRFSQRWATLLEQKGFSVIRYEEPYGCSHSAEKLEKLLHSHPTISTVWIVHGETSTGVLNPLKELLHVIKSTNPSIMCIVDAVSTIGSEYFNFDEWDVDIAFTSSCKGLISPAGLGCIFTKNRIVSLNKNRFSDNLMGQKLSQPWTPPIQLLYAFENSLRIIQEYGIDTYQLQIKENKKLLCSLLQAHSIEIFGENTLNSVTVLRLPNTENFLETLNKEHTIQLITAQDHLKNDYYRIGTFGFIQNNEIEQLVKTLSNYY